ncbi:MAG TPA: hypothetical protein VNL74_11620 [Methylococcus sp.]|nr:hypothetical protein [Methylococcus sp.]
MTESVGSIRQAKLALDFVQGENALIALAMHSRVAAVRHSTVAVSQ